MCESAHDKECVGATPLLRELVDGGLDLCVVSWPKMETALTESPPDIDVVVRPMHPKSLVRRIHDFVVSSGGDVVQTVRYEADALACTIRLTDSPSSSVKLDFSGGFRMSGRVLLAPADLLDPTSSADCLCCRPASTYAYYLAKRALKRALDARTVERLAALARQDPDGASRWTRRLLGHREAERFERLIARTDRGATESETSRVRDSLLRRTASWGRLRYLFGEIGRLASRIAHPTGLLVVVVGADGSGKTAVIDSLARTVPSAFDGVQRFHFRPGLLPKRGGSGMVANPHASKPYGLLGSALKLVWLVGDFVFGWWVVVFPALVRTRLVIFDRYYSDISVDPTRYRYGGPLWLLGLGHKLVPDPDLTIVLDAPSRTLIERKQEVSVEELERIVSAYRSAALAKRGWHVVDGSRSLEEVTDACRESIEEALANRTRKRWGLEDRS